MASISTYLQKISEAVYGEEVRSSIRDAIEAINTESSDAKSYASAARDSAQAYANAAKASEINAKSSETTASTKAGEASASANVAKASEVTASTKAVEAAASAGAARTSETNAKASETIASAKAEEASASANAAKASETNAKASEVTASTKAGEAAASAGAARTSETQAAQKAGEAADAQSAAEQAKEDAAASALSAQQYSGKPPKPQNGTWWIWDATQQKYIDTGIGCELVGPTGNGIQDLKLTSGDHSPGTTDIYTVTMTDGTATVISVYNGRNGTGAGDVLGIWFDLVLPASGWLNGEITIADNRLVALSTHKYFVSADEASREKYLECNVQPRDITTTGFITFKNDTDPTEDLTVNVIRFELSANGTS